MRVMTLKQFLAHPESQQASPPQEVYAMKVREFLNAIETQCGDHCTAIVTVNPQEPNTLCVKFVEFGGDQISLPEYFASARRR